jgi:hypothetical protein
MSYNGWKNYETWNVALWIQNDEVLYNLAREIGMADRNYASLASLLVNDFEIEETPDGVAWNDSRLALADLDEMIAELGASF